MKLPETNAMLLAAPQAMRKAGLSADSNLVRSSSLFPEERAMGATMQPEGLSVRSTNQRETRGHLDNAKRLPNYRERIRKLLANHRES